MTIPLKPGLKPEKLKSYPQSPRAQEIINKIFNALYIEGYIERRKNPI